MLFVSFPFSFLKNYTRFLLCLNFLLYVLSINAQNQVGYALRINEEIKIDGLLNESSWENAEKLTNFKQYDPHHKSDVTFQTEVRILYDDDALYVGAHMFDKHTDSLLLQLGNRDASLNADAFGIKLDTYNKQNDAFVFELSASGVQTDYRDNDTEFNAVWESAVKISEGFWVAELRIPYAAIRFPSTAQQIWRIQLYRNLRRIRELSQWALEDKHTTNKKAQWGELNGIYNIKAPLRLSFTPYITIHGEHYPYNIENTSNYSRQLAGGVDLKMGIGEGHTLDVTLLPDFSQVQSDNQIKNLTAFETVYDENRPFFQESVDLFNKGGLFYSRRIGRIPLNYYNINKELDSSEYIILNPYQAKLINASKFSGRDKKGLAFGFFNAITDNTYAHIGDSINGERLILTDPMTNYNILILDKAFKNSSSIYAINTHVYRNNNFNCANVSGAGVNLLNNKNTYNLNISGAQSYIYNPKLKSANKGYTYYVNIGKVKGNFLFNAWHNLVDDNFDKNDMGVLLVNNIIYNGINLNYNIYNPFSRFLYFKTRISFKKDIHYTTLKTTNNYLELFATTTFRNYLSVWSAFYSDINAAYDYYEPRMTGRFYKTPVFNGCYLNFSSDYRKTLALDGGLDISKSNAHASSNIYLYLIPILRMSNHFSFNHKSAISLKNNNLGYAGSDNSNVYFGQRDLQTIENSFSSLYVFKNDLSLSLRARHYWAIGKYNKYYLLNINGELESTENYNQLLDFNFNSFNIDLVFSWQFAPGSNLSIIWKNILMNENSHLIYNYMNNLSHTFDNPQLNTLTLKFLYYIDYVTVKKKLRKNSPLS